MNFWQQSVDIISGISDKGKAEFEKLGIFTLYDLLWHLPINYQDYRIKKIASLKNSLISQKPFLIEGKIIQKNFVQSRRKYWRVVLEDDSGAVDILFFNLPYYLSTKLQIGKKLECFGSVYFAGNKLAMMHPKFKIFSAGYQANHQKILSYQAIYPHSKKLTQALVQKAVGFCLNHLKTYPIKSQLDSKFLHLPSLLEALLFLHRPPITLHLDDLDQQLAIKRLVVDELMHLLISSELAKLNRQQSVASVFKMNSSLNIKDKRLTDLLEFQLNNDQKKCIQEVRSDLAKGKPMQRLIQGDVGSGKTIVSAFCALSVLNQGSKVALLAPTEVLANQHYLNFQKWFKPLGVKVFYLSRSVSTKARKKITANLLENQPCILIGTHIIFQKTIQFKNLSLVMIDEPQRFGVLQRLELLEKGKESHQLLISATPIPRTLAQSIYADLEVSQIKEKPANRQAVVTVILNRKYLDELIERVNKILDQREQVYWVCPRIEEDNQGNLISAEKVFQELKSKIKYPIQLIHGKMKNEVKNTIINDFHQQKIKLLVATTVIEVGIDSPNASVMVIENANKLGLSTLHQLRGRVGRGEKKGYCVLIYDEYLSPHQKNRLEMIKKTNDGFEIAEYDLKTRGAGDLFGSQQKGSKIWQFFKVPEDQVYLNQAKEVAHRWIKEDINSAKEYLAQRSAQDRIAIHRAK